MTREEFERWIRSFPHPHRALLCNAGRAARLGAFGATMDGGGDVGGDCGAQGRQEAPGAGAHGGRGDDA